MAKCALWQVNKWDKSACHDLVAHTWFNLMFSTRYVKTVWKEFTPIIFPKVITLNIPARLIFWSALSDISLRHYNWIFHSYLTGIVISLNVFVLEGKVIDVKILSANYHFKSFTTVEKKKAYKDLFGVFQSFLHICNRSGHVTFVGKR